MSVISVPIINNNYNNLNRNTYTFTYLCVCGRFGESHYLDIVGLNVCVPSPKLMHGNRNPQGDGNRSWGL